MMRAMFALAMMLAASVYAADPLELPVWPDRDPGDAVAQEKVGGRNAEKPDRFISNIAWPTLTVYLPPEDRNTGAAVVICPGGGYSGVAIDKEGHDVARWLNSIGVAGIVLKYRMPKPDVTGAGKPWPLEDAQRAIRIVRGRAAEWKIDPGRVGILGFSAGGHLASTAGTHYDAGDPAAADPLDRLSCRPDFMVLIYPVITFKDPVAHTGSRNNLLGKSPDPKLVELYCNELQVNAQTPPAFLVHAKDDPVKVENSMLFHNAMQKIGAVSELALYDTGGHGFGLGVRGGDVATWPARCAEWMKSRKLLDRK